jgi:hypothetical protein
MTALGEVFNQVENITWCHKSLQEMTAMIEKLLLSGIITVMLSWSLQLHSFSTASATPSALSLRLAFTDSHQSLK